MAGLARVLQSDWQQRWDDAMTEGPRRWHGSCETFLEQQRRWRERDVLALQRLPLAERVERYRALGPLTFRDHQPGRRRPLSLSLPAAPGGRARTFSRGGFFKTQCRGEPGPAGGYGVILAQYEPHHPGPGRRVAPGTSRPEQAPGVHPGRRPGRLDHPKSAACGARGLYAWKTSAAHRSSGRSLAHSDLLPGWPGRNAGWHR